MKDGSFRAATLLLTIGLWMVGSTALAASPSQAELKAKKEGKLLVLASQDASTLASLSKAFKKGVLLSISLRGKSSTHRVCHRT